jgi:SanA protein
MPDAAQTPAVPGPRRRWLKGLLAAVVVVAAFMAGANAYLIAKARAVTVSGVDTAPVRTYAIVLGNRVFEGGIVSGALGARLATALELYRSGRAQKLIASGLAIGNYNEPQVMADWLVTSGVPRANIILDLGGRRTAATMANARALGVREALVVSQGYHLPRALYFASHAGIDAVGVPAVSGNEDADTEFRFIVRETVARSEALVEVALRGVR